MNLSEPYAALFPGIEGKVLKVLARTTRRLTGREIARLAEVSHFGANQVLSRLVDEGLVFSEEAGRAILYRFNSEHMTAEAITLLMSTRARFLGEITIQIQNWKVLPTHFSVFGSAARGDGDNNSDIDILVVNPSKQFKRETWDEQLESLRSYVLERVGNNASLHDITAQEFKSLSQHNPELWEELAKDAIVLFGEKIQKTPGAKKRVVGVS